MGRAQPAPVIGIVLADRGRRQRGLDARFGVHDRRDERIGIRPRPWSVVAQSLEAEPVDGAFDPRDQGRRRFAVGREHCVGGVAEPASVRLEPILAKRLAPRRIVVSRIGGGSGRFEHDPAMRGEDAAPPHRLSRKYPNDGLLVGCRPGQQPGAGPIRRPPIRIAALRVVDQRRCCDGQQEEQTEQGQGGLQQQRHGITNVGGGSASLRPRQGAVRRDRQPTSARRPSA